MHPIPEKFFKELYEKELSKFISDAWLTMNPEEVKAKILDLELAGQCFEIDFWQTVLMTGDPVAVEGIPRLAGLLPEEVYLHDE